MGHLNNINLAWRKGNQLKRFKFQKLKFPSFARYGGGGGGGVDMMGTYQYSGFHLSVVKPKLK